MRPLLDLQFLFVAGKGGVGRTTTSAALALAAARQGKRVLVAMCNAKERLGQLLGVPPIGSDIVSVGDGVDAVNMHPRDALEEYGRMVLKVKALYQAVFGNRWVTAFLRATPGIDAWSMLGKTYYHATSETNGRPTYDLVIVDGPATGHSLDMLRVPQVIVDVAPPGLLRREAERAMSLFSDPARAGFVIVTLPEEMPVNETFELHRGLVDLHFPVRQLIVNGMWPPIFAGEDHDFYQSLPARLPHGSILGSLARAGRTRVLREQLQAASLDRLDHTLDVPQMRLPYLFVPEFGRTEIEHLSVVLADSSKIERDHGP